MTSMTTGARRVLGADDDRDVRNLVRTLLERAGHEVVEAADGRECLQVLYAKRPELVVLDVRLEAGEDHRPAVLEIHSEADQDCFAYQNVQPTRPEIFESCRALPDKAAVQSSKVGTRRIG
jgi:CheY-like chemotaxis protein